MNYMKNFILGIPAGVCIGLGGTLFLSVENPVVGALLFTLGLFTIVTNGFYLVTGKVGYAFGEPASYWLELLFIWFGNLMGTGLFGYALRLTRRMAPLQDRVTALCQLKLSDNLLSIFLLSVFCNMCLYIAVDGFRNNPHSAGKYIGLFLGVGGFVLCGFEHVVANMFYFSFANLWTAQAWLCILVMTAGNAVGGLLIPFIMRRKIVQ